MPEVAEARTIENFIPSDQSRKLTLIRHAERSLGPALDTAPEAAPTDDENIAALRHAAEALNAAAGKSSGRGAQAARRLAGDLSQLTSATESDRVRATNAFIIPLEMDLDSLRQSLKAKPFDMKSLPQDLLGDWVTQDGRERVDILPKGNPNDDMTIADFARAVLVAEPTATGQAVEILKWAETMIRSLIQAAAIAFCAIAVLLWISVAPDWRCAVDARPSPGGGSCDARNLRLDRLSSSTTRIS